MAGRGFGKTLSGASGFGTWQRPERQSASPWSRNGGGRPRRHDRRGVWHPGDFKPRVYAEILPEQRRLVWPNGVVALTFSSEKPNRLRGPNFSHAWIDEPAAWEYAQKTYDMLMFGLRIGENPQLFATTTPRATPFVKGLVADPAIQIKKGSTYENRVHLAPAFFSEILAKYEGSRLGRQEIDAEILEVGEGAWFQHFEDARNVTIKAEYVPGSPVYVAVDAGVSRYTGAIWFQSWKRDKHRTMMSVFADYLAVDLTSRENAEAIKALTATLPCQGIIDGRNSTRRRPQGPASAWLRTLSMKPSLGLASWISGHSTAWPMGSINSKSWLAAQSASPICTSTRVARISLRP